MKVVIVVQARMTSTRLPGKVLKTILDKPLLEFQIERLRKIQNVTEIILATTINDSDQPIVNCCRKLDIPVFRGSEDDVLARFHGAAITYQGDIVVRITADCPLIDPKVSQQTIQFYLDHQAEYDYISNTRKLTFPRGLDTEVFSYTVLNEAFKESVLSQEREHVTPFLYRQPGRYRIGNYANFEDQSRHRWTVDTPEDFELIRRIIETLYPKNPNFRLADILALLKEHPEWSNINAHIEQKK